MPLKPTLNQQLPTTFIPPNHLHTSDDTTTTDKMKLTAFLALGIAALVAADVTLEPTPDAAMLVKHEKTSEPATNTASMTSATSKTSTTKKSKGVAPATGIPILAARGALGAAVVGFLV
jgi:hypothetical protein